MLTLRACFLLFCVCLIVVCVGLGVVLGRRLFLALPPAAADRTGFRASEHDNPFYIKSLDVLQSARDAGPLGVSAAIPPPVAGRLAQGSGSSSIPWHGMCAKDTPLVALQAYIESTPTLAAWYAGFAWDQARIVGAPQGMRRHVAYRHGDGRVYWTRQPLLLTPGEPLVTDGVRTMRGWCCNELASVPPAPPHQNEPPTEALQPPAMLPPALPPLLTVPPIERPPWVMWPPRERPPLELPPVLVSGPPPGVPLLPPIITLGGRPPVVPVPVQPPGTPPITPVPEPSTLALALMGFLWIFVLQRRCAMRKPRPAATSRTGYRMANPHIFDLVDVLEGQSASSVPEEYAEATDRCPLHDRAFCPRCADYGARMPGGRGVSREKFGPKKEEKGYKDGK